jgi:hypothetical protein
MAPVKVRDLVSATKINDGIGDSDTIKLWESYRDQALLWRAIALLQVPVTMIALIVGIVAYVNREITLNVPARPLPGQHAAQDIPDSEFIDSAQNFVNLIATYQPLVVRRQFNRAAEMTVAPLLPRFQKEYLMDEVQVVETTARAQMFFVDPVKTTVERQGPQVLVTFIGERIKSISGRQLEPVETKFQVGLITIPRTDLNPYGIVIKDLAIENTKPEKPERQRKL